ncbi:MAG: ATP-binding protein [Oscillatoria sp. SIO1A7]|nr:ATP-binding protein [Oscillatoria sp. SIO1A7]
MIDQPIRESISIEGHLGPIRAVSSPLVLEISPLTVFIGPQGTGKSLVSQLLYFFRDAQYLISGHSKQDVPDVSVTKVIEGIRSGENSSGSFSSFVMGKSVNIQYIRKQTDQPDRDWTITYHEQNRQIIPKNKLRKEIESWLTKVADNPASSGEIQSQAVFVPAERSFFSRLINSAPQSLGSRDLPITMREFTRVLFKAADTHQKWQEEKDGELPLEASEIEDIIARELRGRAVFSRKGSYARRWQWMPEQSERPIEIEMASSGQMETWPMVSMAQAMFGWEPWQRPLFIHIEEPETHLHPSAQVAIAKLLAYLCNKGFRLVITTHSLFILYVLNNLVLAAQNLQNKDFSGLPVASQRLNPNLLSAYLFSDGTAISIRDRESGELDESKLSSVLGNLEMEYNHIQAYDILWS